MGKAVEFGIKKKRAVQAVRNEEILLHSECGAVRALALEVVGPSPVTMLRAQHLGNGESALLALNDLRLLSKSEWRSVKGKEGIEAIVALRDHLAAQTARLEFSDLKLLQPFKLDDSGDEYVKVGNTSAICTRIIRGTSLFVRLEDANAETEYVKVRVSKHAFVTRITQ